MEYGMGISLLRKEKITLDKICKDNIKLQYSGTKIKDKW